MNKNKILWGVVLLLGTLAIGGVIRAYAGGNPSTVIENIENATFSGTPEQTASLIGSTSQTNPTYLVGSDDYTSLPSFYLWNTAGGLEVAGKSYLNGESSLGRLIEGGSIGSVATDTATYTLSSANLCDNSELILTSNSSTQTVRGTVWTLPATTTLFADCLTANGKQIALTVVNGSTQTSSQIVAGTGGTLRTVPTGSFASSTLGNSNPTNSIKLTIIRETDIAYRVLGY